MKTTTERCTVWAEAPGAAQDSGINRLMDDLADATRYLIGHRALTTDRNSNAVLTRAPAGAAQAGCAAGAYDGRRQPGPDPRGPAKGSAPATIAAAAPSTLPPRTVPNRL